MVAAWLLAGLAHGVDLEVGGGGHATVADALLVAVDNDVLRLHAGTYSGSHTVTVDLTVEPWGDGPVTLQVYAALNETPMSNGFFHASNAAVTVRDVIIDANGFRAGKSSSQGTLTLERVEVFGANRDTLGGALYALHAGSGLILADSIVRDGFAGTDGGAIATDAGTIVIVTGTRFERNEASARGGALRCRGQCVLTDNVFVQNEAVDGGAVWIDVDTGSALVRNQFIGNSATTGGAASIGSVGLTEFDYNTFWSNTATDGGAIWTSALDLLARNNSFLLNSASANGAVIYRIGGHTTLLNSIVVHEPLSVGASLFSDAEGNLEVRYLLLDGNVLGNPDMSTSVLTGDPLFTNYLAADPEGSDLTLTPPSPAVCAGDGAFDVHLGAFTLVPEIPGDGYDSDCDGIELCYLDEDGDGVGVGGPINGATLDCTANNEAPVAGDCDDGDAVRFPGNAEVPADGVDQDCDLLELCYGDVDGDGFGPGAPDVPSDYLDCMATGVAPFGGDCDDADDGVHPNAEEVCNGVDDNCDTTVDNLAIGDCTTTTTTTTTTNSGVDVDGDGVSPPADCNDADPEVYPDAIELCNGIDDDCDGTVDGPSCDRDGTPPSSETGAGCRCDNAAPPRIGLLVLLLAPWAIRRIRARRAS